MSWTQNEAQGTDGKKQEEQVFCVYLTQTANWQCTGVCGLLRHASRHLLTFDSDIGHREVNPKRNPVVESQKDLSVRCLWGLFHLLTYTACSQWFLSSILELPIKVTSFLWLYQEPWCYPSNWYKLSKTAWAANSVLCNVMGAKRCPVWIHQSHIPPQSHYTSRSTSLKLQCTQAYLMAMHQLSVSVMAWWIDLHQHLYSWTFLSTQFSQNACQDEYWIPKCVR